MSVGALRSSAAKPDIADLLARARAIGELARERAQQTETERRVGDDMIERMRQADLFRVMQPRVRVRLRRIRPDCCRHCQRMRLDRLGLRSARLPPVARLPPALMRRLRWPWQRTAATGYPAWGLFAAAATMRSGSFSAV